MLKLSTSHPIHGDADQACRWLCESAGRRTHYDDFQIAAALENLPHRGQSLPLGAFPEIDILSRVK